MGGKDEDFVPDADAGAGPSGPPPLRYTWNPANPEGSRLHGLPTRHDFVVKDEEGRRLHGETLRALESGGELLFLPWDVEEATHWPPRVPGKWDENRVALYQLNLLGVLRDGSNVRVVVNDAPVYFGVWLSAAAEADAETAADWEASLMGMLQEFGVLRAEDDEAFPLDGFRPDKRPYKRLYFPNLDLRAKAIQAARKHGFETLSDDKGKKNYFRLLAREFQLPVSDWLYASGYSYQKGGQGCSLDCPVGSCGGSFAFPRLAASPVDDRSPLSAHVLTVPFAALRPLVNPITPDPAAAKLLETDPALARDRTAVITWDIETHSPDKGLGTPPNACKPHDVVFNLCASLHWRTSVEPLARVSLVTQEAAPDARWHTVVCGPGGSPHNVAAPNVTYGQDSLIMAYAELYRLWGPNLRVGFNDMGYDDPFVVEKARQMRLLAHMAARMSAVPRWKSDDDGIYKFQYNDDRKVKVSAEKQVIINYLKFPGCVPVDARVMYMKLFPKADKTSLKAFLAMVGLGGKADMPYTLMWKFYERAVAARDRYCEALELQRYNNTPAAAADVAAAAAEGQAAAEKMRYVAHYCVTDAVRCQELLDRHNVTQNYRDITTLSFTSFPDGIFYANGHKVCNMLMAYAGDHGIKGSMIAVEFELEGKYDGAFVLFPVKGLEEERPVTGLDFASLYPSIMMAYNLSKEKAVLNEADVEKYRAMGYTVMKTPEFSFGSHKFHGHFVQHDNDDAKLGIAPRVLIDLKTKRSGMKKVLKPLEAEIEHLETVDGAYREVVAAPEAEDWRGFFEHYRRTLEQVNVEADECAREALSAEEDEVAELKFRAKTAAAQGEKMRTFLEERAGEIARLEAGGQPTTLDVWFQKQVHEYFEEIEFKFSAIDSKQKAVKVFMNTFYGESGNKRSPIFLLVLAGAVTSLGKENLKAVWAFVVEKGFTVMYGDTDSLYLCCPHAVYKEVVDAYWETLRGLGVVPPPDAGNGAPGSVGDPAELWDQRTAEIASERRRREEAFAAMRAKIAEHARVPLESPAFASNHPDFAAALAQGEALLAEKLRSLRQAEAALGPRPSEKAAENLTWLRDVYAERPDLRKPVEEAYLHLCKQRVRITMKVMAVLRDEVNAFLRKRTGSKYLSMAYEEALFPYISTGKKKYFGIAHVNKPNFGITDPRKLFIRGIDVVKQGQTPLAREIGYQCMWAATRPCPPGDRDPLIDRVIKVVRDNCEKLSAFRANDPPGEKWGLDDFVQSDAWKPEKMNPSVHRFMGRMRARHKIQLKQNELRVERGEEPTELDYIQPEPGERFPYVLVKTDRAYDLQGYAKGEPKKGDMMEYVHVAVKHGLKIDVPYYLIHYVVGLCARFINYEDRFQAPPSVQSEKLRDEKSQNNAKRFLTNLIKSFGGSDKSANAARGRAYKRVYSAVAGRASEVLKESLGDHASILLGLGGLIGKETRAEKEEAGALDFELFLPVADEDEDGAVPYSAVTSPDITENLLRLAANRARVLCDDACEPSPRWGRSPNGHFRGMVEAAVEGFGVDGTPAGRKRLYEYLAVLEPPTRRAQLRQGPAAKLLDQPARARDRFLRGVERRACEAIEQWSPALTDLATRIETTLEDLVTMGRALESGGGEATPEALEASMDDTVRSLACGPAERRAVRDVHFAWNELVAAAFQRESRRRLAARLAALRDRAA